MIVRVADSYLVLDSLSLQSSPKLGSHGELMQKLGSSQSSVTFGDIVEVDALHSQKKSLLLFLRGSNVNVLYSLSVRTHPACITAATVGLKKEGNLTFIHVSHHLLLYPLSVLLKSFWFFVFL